MLHNETERMYIVVTTGFVPIKILYILTTINYVFSLLHTQFTKHGE